METLSAIDFHQQIISRHFDKILVHPEGGATFETIIQVAILFLGKVLPTSFSTQIRSPVAKKCLAIWNACLLLLVRFFDTLTLASIEEIVCIKATLFISTGVHGKEGAIFRLEHTQGNTQLLFISHAQSKHVFKAATEHQLPEKERLKRIWYHIRNMVSDIL